MKRIAITTFFHSGISLKSIHIKVEELWFLRQYLLHVYKADEVDYLVNKPIESYEKSVYDVNLNDYDEVFIHNSRYDNMFGGVFEKYPYAVFKKLLSFNGKIKYVLTDPALFYKDLGDILKSKLINDKYKQNFNLPPITISECEQYSQYVSPKIECMFCGLDFEKYKKLYKDINKFYPIEKGEQCQLVEFIAANQRFEFPHREFENREYDFIYYGNKKGTYRTKILNKLFKNNDLIYKLWLGYDPEYVNCDIYPKDYIHKKELLNVITTAYSTLVLGDEGHNKNMRAQRMYEGWNSDVVVFFYDEFVNDQIIQGKELRDFVTIYSKDELNEKINLIKSDKNLFKHLLELQKQEIEYFNYLKVKTINKPVCKQLF